MQVLLLAKVFLLSFCIIWLLPAVAAATPRAAVTAAEAEEWIRHTVPLPKDIAIESRVTVNPATVAIILPDPADEALEQAAAGLRVALGVPPEKGDPANPAFTITLRLGGPEADALRELHNAGQAYHIAPLPGDSGLVLVALTSRGLLYAAKTLQQLIAPKASAGVAQIPLLRVTDWPDLADRGLWGTDTFLNLPWLADRKLNYVEQIAARSVDATTKQGSAGYKSEMEPMLDAARYGITPQPAILHLEQHANTGVFEAFPDLRAVGAKEGVWCYTVPDPDFPYAARVLADWMTSLAQLPGVQDASVWMTENLSGGGACKEPGHPNVNEAKAILAGFREAKKRVPNLGLRIMTSEAIDLTKVLDTELIPEDVKIWYYHSLSTYTAYKTGIIPRAVEDFIAAGRYVGVVPTISAFWSAIPMPFTSAHFVRYRLEEVVSKGLQGIMAYAIPRVNHTRYNIEAMAEWAWNKDGRSPREFAISWAVRQGLPDPARFAEWAETMGPVTWDIYGGGWPESEHRKRPGFAADLLRKGALPKLGTVQGTFKGPWSQITSTQQFHDDILASIRAVGIAEELANDELYQESIVANGHLTALRSLYALRDLMPGGRIREGQTEAVTQLFNLYVAGLRQVAEAMRQWDREVNAYAPYQSTVDAVITRSIDGSVDRMVKLAKELNLDIQYGDARPPAFSAAQVRAGSEGAVAWIVGDVRMDQSGRIHVSDPTGSVRVKGAIGLPSSGRHALAGLITTDGDEKVVAASISFPVN